MFLFLMLAAMTIAAGEYGMFSLKVTDGDFGLWIYNKNNRYEVYTSMEGNSSLYSYPMVPILELTYDGNYTIK